MTHRYTFAVRWPECECDDPGDEHKTLSEVLECRASGQAAKDG